MKFISHRGNLNGKDESVENTPKQITKALALGYDVEIDVWLLDSKYYLGHDAPTTEIEKEFLEMDGLWIHCKNVEAFIELSIDPNINCFFHEGDDVVLTTQGYLWTHLKCFTYDAERSICLMFDFMPGVLVDQFFGLCSDDIQAYREEWEA